MKRHLNNSVEEMSAFFTAGVVLDAWNRRHGCHLPGLHRFHGNGDRGGTAETCDV